MSITVDLNGCARCHGDGHAGLTFHELTRPLIIGNEQPLTHWALCPTNGEPILMRVEDEARIDRALPEDYWESAQ